MIWEDNKRYNSLDGFFKRKFGCKIAKITLNGGFTCPNRDGTKAVGGCIYCSDKLSGEFAGNPAHSVSEQMNRGIVKIKSKWKNVKYMPYFQAGTNTYAPIGVLKPLFEEAVSYPDTVGLSIATRPDCISEETLLYLSELNKRCFLTVELGLQSIFDTTGEIINRHTTYAEFLQCFSRLKDKGIAVCVHLINGLPYETRDMMLESVRQVSALQPWSLKLHLLHIIKGTVCEKMYNDGLINTFSLEDYVELICDQLEIIDPNIVIQRLTGDGSRDSLVAPMWSVKKFEVLNTIDKELLRRDGYQGKKHNIT